MAIQLGEITTLSLAASKKASLRTTVPMSVIKQFGLKQRDKLEWTFEVKGGKIIIEVRPIKMSNERI